MNDLFDENRKRRGKSDFPAATITGRHGGPVGPREAHENRGAADEARKHHRGGRLFNRQQNDRRCSRDIDNRRARDDSCVVLLDEIILSLFREIPD